MGTSKQFGYEIRDKKDMDILFRMIIEEILYEVTFAVKEELTEYIMSTWYRSYSPGSYERTKEYLNSITSINVRMDENGYLKTEVFFDTDKINPHIRPLQLNAHASFYGKDVSEMIPTWIENGNIFMLGRKDAYAKQGVKSMEHIQEWANRNFIKMFKNRLKDYGLTFYK